jgi:hypothetical protein
MQWNLTLPPQVMLSEVEFVEVEAAVLWGFQAVDHEEVEDDGIQLDGVEEVAEIGGKEFAVPDSDDSHSTLVGQE